MLRAISLAAAPLCRSGNSYAQKKIVLSGSLIRFADRSLGRCPACMSKAFLSALGAIALAVVLRLSASPSWRRPRQPGRHSASHRCG
jgi:hypothetical protein